ncbi:MAG: hypothetical protein ABIQ35_01690, partial [Verrucomicrobiota bacterium]
MKKNTCRLYRSLPFLFVTLFGLAVCPDQTFGQPATAPIKKFWKTDGAVYSILVTNNTVYLGGQFTYVGPDSGSVGIVDVTNAESDKTFPVIEGSVNSAAPDGNGGWYIGGVFTFVGGIQRSNLAHIKADKSVDGNWNPASNGSNTVIVVSGGVVYVGGAFTR